MKTKSETIFVCSSCGNEFTKWQGQCSFCGEWNSLKEVSNKFSSTDKKGRTKTMRGVGEPTVVNLGKNEQEKGQPQGSAPTIISTNIPEFDRVLGKGVVQGSVVLFSGEPGIGKSTLLTQLIGKMGGLYVSGEESAEQIRLRVERLGLDGNKFDILGTNSIDEVIEFLDRTNNVYKIAIVDSIQVMMVESAPPTTSQSWRAGGAGSMSQIREATFRLVQLAKNKNIAIFIVGHVTKEGEIAGPKLLEHMVDTVLYFEGERSGDLRILRTIKNRFGATDEVGVFRMEEGGLKEVRGEEINLTETDADRVGAVRTVVMEGTRPMLLEVQALVVESFAPMPKRNFVGVDYNRGQLLVAVAQKYLNIPLYKYDVFISVTGGIRIEDTGADLAVVAAIWSSFKETPLGFAASPSSKEDRGLEKGRNNKYVFFGEVSLLGEVKKIRGWEKREKEAKSLGWKIVDIKNIRELKNG